MPDPPHPPPRRQKSYTGDTGLVYQYYFVGKRPALPTDPEAPATEYVFDVSADRKLTFAVSVFLKPDALDAFAAAHGRSLTDSEQYAAAKLRFLRALDELDDMLHLGRRLSLDASNILDLLSPLGLE